MQRSLDGFMKFYNERGPHQGYRLHGRTPADLYTGAISDLALETVKTRNGVGSVVYGGYDVCPVVARVRFR